MDPTRNPFSPGAGTRPPALAGREDVIEKAEILLARTANGRTDRSIILIGLRGVGKTVLLNEMERLAEEHRFFVISVEAHEEKSLPVLIAPHLRAILYKLHRLKGAQEKVRRGIAVLKSFVSSIKLKFDDIPIGIDIEPERGSADSGDLEIDLPELFRVVGEAAADRGRCIALLIDELQHFGSKELSALIMAMHKLQQRGLPLVLFGAGLPILPRLAGESKSYAERLFNFPAIGPLEDDEARRALVLPVRSEGAEFEDGALDAIVEITQGYPYFIQEWGYQAWNEADESPIRAADVESATGATIERLDENFFRVRFDRLSPSEKRFLRAMAESNGKTCGIGEIAKVLNLKATSLATTRAKLIYKGMIYSPQHGELQFTVPLFDEFMKRAMPDLPAR